MKLGRRNMLADSRIWKADRHPAEQEALEMSHQDFRARTGEETTTTLLFRKSSAKSRTQSVSVFAAVATGKQAMTASTASVKAIDPTALGYPVLVTTVQAIGVMNQVEVTHTTPGSSQRRGIIIHIMCTTPSLISGV
jgi:hypothetical protein